LKAIAYRKTPFHKKIKGAVPSSHVLLAQVGWGYKHECVSNNEESWDQVSFGPTEEVKKQ
jgi:hypothetical protein